MAFGHVIAPRHITDAETYPTHVKIVGPILEEFRSAFHLRTGQSKSDEGEPPGKRDAGTSFLIYETVHEGHHSDGYSKRRLCDCLPLKEFKK